MNLEPFHSAAAETTSLFHPLLQSLTDTSAIWPDLGADGSGLLMPALAGVAAAVTVALMLAVYVQTGYRSYRDTIRHGLAAALGLSLLAFVIYDMRNAALAHIAKVSPAAEFELQWQTTTARAKTLAAEMERTTRSAPEAHQG